MNQRALGVGLFSVQTHFYYIYNYRMCMSYFPTARHSSDKLLPTDFRIVCENDAIRAGAVRNLTQ